jgi:hypothetical protein
MLGSIINEVMATVRISAKPVVGMGATELMWTDRHAYTIVEVVSDKRLVVQQDKAIVVKGGIHNGSAEYRYEPDPSRPLKTLTLRKDGRWHEGTTMQGAKFAIGWREEYYDPSF